MAETSPRQRKEKGLSATSPLSNSAEAVNVPPRRSSQNAGMSASPPQARVHARSSPPAPVNAAGPAMTVGDWLGFAPSPSLPSLPYALAPVLAPALSLAPVASPAVAAWLTASVAPLSLQPDNAEPHPDPTRFAHDDFSFHTRNAWSADKDRVVRGPFDYLNGQPGKDFRTQLINGFNAWLQVPAASLEAIMRIVGMLHTASLLVDDVEDSASLRRGLPVAHSIFGVAQTVNSANYIYFCALDELRRLKSPNAVAYYADELVNLHRGQGMDLFWRDTLTCPTEDDYLEMVGNKTGGLFRLGIKLMQAEAGAVAVADGAAAIDCVPLANIIGLIFQIRDDYLNLASAEYGQHKGLCEDLTEGKFSFPVIHSLRSDPSCLQLLNILRQRTTDAAVKRYAVAHMQRTGSFDYTRRVVNVLVTRARRLADEIDSGHGRNELIHAILDKRG